MRCRSHYYTLSYSFYSFKFIVVSLLYSLSSLPVSLLLPFQDFHRVVVYYQTQYVGKKYISPIPLISAASHVIIATIHLNNGKDGKCMVSINDVFPNDPSLNQMWIDVARMQGSGIKVMGMLGGALDKSFQYLHQDFDKYYAPLKSCFATLVSPRAWSKRLMTLKGD